MTLYTCECGKTKEISTASIVYRDEKWVTKQAECECGLYMTSEPTEGMPSLKRTEASLSMKIKGDRLWDEAKEKIVGKRGVNESFD